MRNKQFPESSFPLLRSYADIPFGGTVHSRNTLAAIGLRRGRTNFAFRKAEAKLWRGLSIRFCVNVEINRIR